MARRRHIDLKGTIGPSGASAVATTHTFTAPLLFNDGRVVPSLAAGEHFMLSVLNALGLAVVEVWRVTAYDQSTGAASMDRAQEGTAAAVHASGTKVLMAFYDSDFDIVFPSKVRVVTGAVTAAPRDLVLADASAGGFSVTLPASPEVGAAVTVQKTDAGGNVVTVLPAGGGTVGSDPSATIADQYAGGVLEHVGGNAWIVTSQLSAVGIQGAQGIQGPLGPAGPTGPAGNPFLLMGA